MGRQIDRLAAFVAETRWADIPPDVQAHARLVLLDTIGVILAGSQRPEVVALRAAMAPGAGRGATLYARGGPQTDPRNAALLNGIAGRAIELCEGLRLVSGQAAAQVLPAALAMAEACDRSGEDLITAFVLGYDAAARLCHAFTPHPLAHQNGQACLIAAAAAGARLRGLDAAGVSLAMRIAASLVLTPSYTNVVAGATALNVPGGMSGFAGALAPELAASGFVAQDNAIEEALSQLVGTGFRPEGVDADLGGMWHITRNYFRLYACCNPIHPALDALSDVLRQLQPQPEQIDRIEFATYRFAAVMRNPAPPNFFASKYSLPHAAAVMAVRGGAGHAELDDTALTDPRVVALRPRVHVTEDVAMTELVPALRPARATVWLTDGRHATHIVQSHRGDFHHPFAESELRHKFRALAGEVLSAEDVAAVEQTVGKCQDLDRARLLADIVSRGAGALQG
ncbi:MAG: MmgE/PrpD family protein [Acetobacteraceae bacterium]|nr:MmgE/PrpD family protein [Pseudomonadota bacterium]